MVPFQNTMASRLVFKRHAGSQMDSARERTATGKQWQISATAEAQLSHHGVAITRISHELGKLRRRIVGGSGAAAQSTGMIFKGVYNGGAYKTQDVVAYTAAGSSAGMYIAIKSVPAGVLPDTGSPYWFAWPNSPPSMFGQ